MKQLLFKINVSIIIKNHNKFLIIKRADTEEVFPGYWGIPGGTVEPEDSNLEMALVRECKEEVGITVTNLQLISNNIVKKEDKAQLYLIYVGNHHSGEPQPLDGTSKIAWMTYDEITQLQLTPHTLEILGLCR